MRYLAELMRQGNFVGKATAALFLGGSLSIIVGGLATGSAFGVLAGALFLSGSIITAIDIFTE